MSKEAICTAGHEERCTSATSPVCACSCGGENHGRARPGVSDSAGMPLTPFKVFNKHKLPVLTVGISDVPLYIILERTVDGIKTNVPRKYVVHSPTGFEWGFGGSGPADLALNILGMFTSAYWARILHQEFKWQYIAVMPEEGGKISSFEIMIWLKERLGSVI